VDTKARFGSKLLPANLVPLWASIFGSSCYGFANIAAPKRMRRLGFGSLLAGVKKENKEGWTFS